MSNPAFRRFGNPGFLRKIKPKNLMRLLRKFAVFFESKGINLSGGDLSSEGGAVLLRRMDQRLGLTAAAARALPPPHARGHRCCSLCCAAAS